MIHHAYCDESRQTQNRFMVFGGLVVPAEKVEPIEAAFSEWRLRRGMSAELKWTKVSRAKLDEYRSFVELGFSLIERDELHFKSVVFDTDEIDYRSHHDNDKDLGFNKLFYHFLLHKFATYARTDEDRLLVFMDERKSSHSLTTLRDVLNSGIRKRYGRRQNVVSAVEARDSKSSDLFQLADVLMGAVGWHCNDCHQRPDCGPAKKLLAERIAERVCLPHLGHQTPFGHRRFEIWRFRFGANKKRPDA